MKLFLKIILCSLLIAGSVHATDIICEFHATKQESAVLLEWATESESDLSRFEIQRSSDQNNWQKIGDKRAHGRSTSKRYYNFLDNNIFKKSNESNFYYRLVLIDQNGNRLTHHIIATASGSSGIRHTWGSIKASFR